MTLARRLGLPDETPRPVLVAIVCYLGHLFCAGWAASSEIFAFFAMLSLGIALTRRVIRPSFHILYVPLVLYGIVSTISSIASPRAIHLFGESALWGKILLFPTALILFREVPRTRVLALRMLLIFGVFSSLFGLLQYVVLGQRDLEHRITGPTAHVMTLSGLLLPVALLFLVFWIHDVRNVWLAAGTVLTTAALAMTYTRSAWLGWMVAVLALIVLKRPRALAWAVPAALILLSFAPLSFFSRIVSSFDTRQSSNLDRIRMFEAGLEIIKDYPVWGVGPANIKEVYPLYRRHDAPRFRIPHLHNNVVQLWAERGVVAVVAYLMLLVLFLRECARGWHTPAKRYAEAGVAVAVGLTAAGMFEFNFGDTEVFWIMLDVFALVIAATERPDPVNEVPASAVAGVGP